MGQAAERGLYMIEIIREESFDSEQEKRELPKNIRQIGSPDIGDRIYIENKVHEYMHPYDALQEKTVYVLLGRFENMIGRQCVFVEAAICLEDQNKILLLYRSESSCSPFSVFVTIPLSSTV